MQVGLSGNRVGSCFFRLGVAGACLLLLAAVAACGGGEKEATPATTTPPSSTPAALPTVDPGAPLTEYRSPYRDLSISYPEGWEELKEQTTPDLVVFSWTEGPKPGNPVAQLTVLCNEGENQTPESLIEGDLTILEQLGGGASTEPTPVEVAGLPGEQVTYTRSYTGFIVEQVAVYVVKGDCGWRIGLDTYGAGSLQSFLPLFERILASFRLD